MISPKSIREEHQKGNERIESKDLEKRLNERSAWYLQPSFP